MRRFRRRGQPIRRSHAWHRFLHPCPPVLSGISATSCATSAATGRGLASSACAVIGCATGFRGRTRSRIECALIIPLIIQTTRLHPSGPDQIDAAPNLSSGDPSDSVQIDAERLPRNRKVVGSNPTSGSTSPQARGSSARLFLPYLPGCHPGCHPPRSGGGGDRRGRGAMTG
jgi:hypothetical protein